MAEATRTTRNLNDAVDDVYSEITESEQDIINIQAILPSKVYYARISQSGTDAPTSTIILNTFGIVPTWTRAGAGSYYLTFDGAPLTSNTIVTQNCVGTTGSTTPQAYQVDDSIVYYETYDGATAADNKMYGGFNCIKIEVFE